LLRLRFQSDHHQWLRILTSIDSPEWRRRQPLEITQCGMLGLVDHWKRSGSLLQQRPNFRLVKTSIGPLTTRVLRGDDLSGEIYEWG
jgi:hypothetical protein